MTSRPKISMAVATDDTYSTVQRTVSFLLKQTVVGDIELIVACPSAQRLSADVFELEQFGAYQIVERAGTVASGQFMAAAIAAARAPAFMYVEEHNFPPPRTAEVAINELVHNEKPALGFGMLPSNPGIVAWSHLYGQFGTAVAPVISGATRRFGGHHAAYRTDLLLEYGDDLSDMMNNEAILHEDLRKRGIPMYLTSEVAIPHTQISDFLVLVRQDYLAQRVYAGARMQLMDWPVWRRIVYVCGAPLIPFKRVATAVYHMFRTRRAVRIALPAIPVMFVAHGAGAIGEALGYIFGADEAVNAQRMEIELDRYSFVSATDREAAQDGQFIRPENMS